MASKLLKNRDGDLSPTATHQGPRPSDFPLRSVESRAAARAVVQRLAAEDDSPREGDIHVDFTFLPIPRAVEIYKIFTDRKEQEQPGSNPRGPRIWIKFPEGFVPPEAKEPVDHRKVMDSLSDEFLEGIIGAKPKGDPKGHRNVKVFRDRPNGNASAQLTDSASEKRN